MDSFSFNKVAGTVLATLLAVQVLRIAVDAIYSTGGAEHGAPAAHNAAPAAEGHAAAPAPAPAAATPAPAPAAGGQMAAAPPPPPAPAPAAQAGAPAPASGGGQVAAAPPAAGSAAPAPAAGGGGDQIAALLATADPTVGQRQSLKCIACHSFKEGEAARVGPNLYNVVGGPMGHAEGYSYSPAMQAKHAAGDKWTYQELDEFLKSPQAHLPGTKMTFTGLPDAKDRANLIAYLRSLSASPQPLP